MHLGNRLREVMASRGINQSELGRKLGVKPQQVYKWVNAEDFRWGLIQELCAALDISETEFLNLG